MVAETLNNITVAELVASDYRTAEVFKRHGIDFCCGGKKSIASVCNEKNISTAEIENEIIALQHQPKDTEYNFNEWTLSFLTDYILNRHHTYVNNNLALISEFAEKVARVHGEHSPETVEINKHWSEVVIELTLHMKKEELLLFPFIKNLESFGNGDIEELPSTHFGTVKNPIRMMEHEHDLAGNLMKNIQSLSKDFTPPDHACNTYRVLYSKLQEFQNDLFQHIHLENNILFPKAILLENSLANDKQDSKI